MSGPDIQLITPESAEDWRETRLILREYAASLNVDLCFQGFEQELAELPGPYCAPGGLLLIATVDGAVAGSGAFRPLPESDYANACEMKRLFVRPAFRRFGLGRMLAQALMDRATEAGYSCMLLDTLDDMEAARGLYESLGFVDVPPYYYNPIPGAHYLKAELGAFAQSYFG
ncbi:GNAT family N-acetyltransferase [Roseateles cellulosilyticus]|uniref:GNAT family N-acetyltransferase n=1 Tax=Pelomonas cellulosilytica TaxID=2906762 RepID=A0ABS8XTK1_9BURK|nr:GNAT family N-acetyltransferase [Pelomonas sp. P8]MCE4554161.1 GNAT family N-acetyltransferase [Pelomonas sp. P8]